MLKIEELRDEDLMRMVRFGKKEAFSVLYRRHSKTVFRWIRRIVSDPNHAEEAVQDVFLSVAKAACHYEPKAKFSTWLFKIAHHAALKVKRKSPSWILADSEFLSSIPKREERDVQIEIGHWLGENLPKLSFQQSSAFSCVVLEKMTYAEAGNVLERPEATIKTQVRRARAQLSEAYHAQNQFHPCLELIPKEKK